ncbi:MAG: putative DNA binding domain-containing protein [candidate division NC10 bacterium]|nr:putative DNA binding domain-containing protein [candidate division NC10 bacterium]
MRIDNLRRLIAQGEGTTLEFKRSTGELREGTETLCGMLNAAGRGQVLFGVSEAGEILGVPIAEKTLREVANASRRIEPAAEVTPSWISIRPGRGVLAVKGVAREPGPFTFEGRGYVRVGNTTQRMSRAEFDRRVVRRLERNVPWDRWIAPEWRVRDLQRDEIHRTIEEAVEAKRLTGALGEKPETVLRRLELVTDRGVTRAAAILFGKEDGPGYPMGEVRLARFRGTTKDEFRDNRQFKGHAFILLQHAERFLDEHVPVSSRFIEGRLRRVDTPVYPPLAIREALVNALVHRDYSVDGGAVSVALFDDRLEIWSTGTLPEGLTPEKLKGDHESVPRNRLIADVFYRRGLIERWGRGTNKILAEAEKAGCPEPDFEEIAGAFVVRFRPSARAQEPMAPVELYARAEKILEILRRSGPLAAPSIHQELGEPITLRALQADLKRLRETGRIISSGRGRATRYRLA